MPGMCAVDGCAQPAVVGGYCRKHYDRLRRRGCSGIVLRGILCPQCNVPQPCSRSTARFCCDDCRKAWHREHPGMAPPEGRFMLAEIGADGHIVRQWRTQGVDDTTVPDTVQWR